MDKKKLVKKYEKKLQTLSNIQAQIESTSFWILFHRNMAEEFANITLEIMRGSEKKALPIIYLINDVTQRANIMGWDDFKIHYGRVIVEITKFAIDSSDKSEISNVLRTIALWEERCVFDGKAIEQLLSTCGIGSSLKKLAIDGLPTVLKHLKYINDNSEKFYNTMMTVDNTGGFVDKEYALANKDLQESSDYIVEYDASINQLKSALEVLLPKITAASKVVTSIKNWLIESKKI